MRSAKLLTALLALTMSSAALAEPDPRKDRYDRSDRYDRYDRYDRSDRYDRYDRYDGERVMVLAHEVDEIAASIYRQAAANNRRPDREEARMLNSLRELAREADQFHRGVERYRRSDRNATRNFEDLVDAFYRTGDALRWVDRRPYVDRGMDRIAGLLSEISRSYGFDDRYDRWSHGRDDRYGHDRYARPRGRYGRGYDDRDRWDDHGRRPPR